MTDRASKPINPDDPSAKIATTAKNSEEYLSQQPERAPNTEREQDEKLAKPQNTGWGWGWDMNAVAGNIGGLFGTGANTENDEDDEDEDDDDDDYEVEDGEDERERHGPGENLGKQAANIANAATAEFEVASKAAQETFGKAAEEIGKGWGTLNNFLDDMLAVKPGGENRTPEENDVHTTFLTIFPEIGKEDEIVDHFKCTLLQKYRCYLNNATPEKTYALRGRLFVSTAHIAMLVTDDGGEFSGKPFGIAIPFADVGKIQKGAKAMLKLVTKEQISYIFAEFESDSHFSGALSLLEHMTAASTPKPPSDDTEVPENKEITASS